MTNNYVQQSEKLKIKNVTKKQWRIYVLVLEEFYLILSSSIDFKVRSLKLRLRKLLHIIYNI